MLATEDGGRNCLVNSLGLGNQVGELATLSNIASVTVSFPKFVRERERESISDRGSPKNFAKK